MQDGEHSTELEPKHARFHASDLQLYIKKYRLTRPLTEVEERMISEAAAHRRPQHKPRTLQSADGIVMAMLRTVTMAIIVSSTLLLALLMLTPTAG
ncbi:MAG: hypothetical protein ACAI44_27650 [Candidatus Sericytochromatia bacterium]